MRAPALRALAFLSAWGRGAAALPEDAARAAAGRRVLPLPRPAREGDRYRRATRECLLGLAAVDAMLEDGGVARQAIAGERTALVYVTAAGYAPSNRAFIERTGGSIHFAYTAPAVVPAEVAIEFEITGPYAILIGGAPATLRAIWHAAGLLEAGVCDRAVVLALEVFEECADLYARARRLSRGPLVEAAGGLLLEPGRGGLALGWRRGGRPAASALRRRLGETMSCEPLAALDLWRSQGGPGPVGLTGTWRGEEARLVWTEAIPGGAAQRRLSGGAG
jgi:hypothetical protein